jgi:glycosyltransferase involved in cell wall biosynthesis
MKEIIDKPLISIITVVYNGAKTLEQTIQSVLNQTYQNIEYILIDGLSNDGSVEIIKKYSTDIKYWVSEKDMGIYDAMNKGLKNVTGELVAILNSDDWYEPDAVQNVVNAYLNDNSIDIFHGLLRFINKDNKPDLISGHYDFFLDKGMIEHPTCFIKKEVYEQIGGFNLTYRSAADYDWMLRARLRGAKFYLISQVLTNFRRGGISESQFGFSEELLIKNKYGIISIFKYTYWRIYSGLLAKLKIK